MADKTPDADDREEQRHRGLVRRTCSFVGRNLNRVGDVAAVAAIGHALLDDDDD